MALSPQSVLIGVVLAVLTLLAAVGVFMNYTHESLMGLILWIAMFAVIVYDTECLANSPCGVWSWIRTVLWALLPIFMIVIVIMAIVKNARRMERIKRGESDEDEDEQ